MDRRPPGDPIQSASRWRCCRSPIYVAFRLWRRGGSQSSSVGGLRPLFWGLCFCFRVNVCRDGVQVVVAASSAIRSPLLQPHLGGNVEKLVGVVWSSGISSSYGIFGSSRSFIDSSSFFFVFGTDVVFLTRSATSRPQPTTSGRLRD
jgi:hypothetical protein